MTMHKQVIRELKKLARPDKVQIYQNFFKTGKGEYGEGDVFLGIKMPDQRIVAKKFIGISLSEIQFLLKRKEHECRMTGLIILTYKYEKAQYEEQKLIYNFYLKNTKYINNWDLVDVTCHKIVGRYVLEQDPLESVRLYRLAESKSLWERRISIVSCLAFIQHSKFDHALKISEMLLKDEHDLIHKAVGWVLREIGKKDMQVEEDFLKKYYKTMPRTMLRYAIERFPEKKRKYYMNK